MKNIFTVLLAIIGNIICIAQDNNTVDSLTIRKVERLLVKSNKVFYSKTDSAKFYAEMMIKISEDMDYDLGVAKGLTNLGIVYDIYGDLAKSFSIHKQAFDLYSHLGFERGKANSQYNIALILVQEGKYEEALSYSMESYNYYEKTQNKIFMANTLGTIGNILTLKGEDLDLIIEKLEEAKSIYKDTENVGGICSATNLQGDAYLKHGEVSLAISHYERARDLLTPLNNAWYLGYSYLGLSKSYLASDQLILAKQNTERAIAQYRVLNHKLRLMEVYEIRVAISEKNDDLRGVISNLKTHQLYKDSIFNEKQSKQTSLLTIEFETKKKEAEIASLSHQASIQLLEIEQKNLAMIIGLIVIFFVLSVIYFIYRQRSLKNQQSQIELEQRFLRSQLNPHFISNALMAVQNFMMKNQGEKAALYLGKFSKLMREILENSRQEFILVEDEVAMLTNYMDIHKMRMNDAFNYKINIDINIDPETDTIPPMFVQPFIENAIEHGIINAKGKGLIELSLVKDGDYISIAIKDNGEGLSTNSSKAQEHTSLSTIIIKERMELFNKSLKNKIQLLLGNYTDVHGEILGTKVELKVPYRYL
jgi:tetratricopeptide (TPR) repeat protein